MRYLAVLCIILSSTLCFTNAGKYKCGPQVKKHNCDCKDKNAGLLKLADDGKLLVCDGAGWKALQYEIPFGSRTNPGSSCKDIRTTQTMRLMQQCVSSLLCDMAGGGGIRVDQGAFDAYNSGDTYDESDKAALDVTKSDRDYKNRIVLNWNNFDKSEARVVLYTGGNQVKELKFDAVGSDKLNWFTNEKLQAGSSWFADIQAGPRNYFSIQGDGGINRDFFINKNYGGCEADAGWLVITGTVCEWEKRHPSNTILYSKQDVSANWDSGEVEAADTLVVYLR
ncbi:Saccharopine dehydrogenase [Desmophyllum pertusum]|uniref:Saccharopine dehydrogenase n=1 Tax=Desmophyllum pertusum TaxID=174260 RepID=A0A9X0CTU1_9CNID|nr:Saccharopine dehydrogenase [Desmophyllum pertusum]